jgi:nonribosomal peptide synthetase DhbF
MTDRSPATASVIGLTHSSPDLLGWFAAGVSAWPDAVAVVDGQRQANYTELDTLSNDVAWFLSEHGVGPEIVVGLCMTRGLDAIAGMLGVLKAGGVYLPLDPGYPAERLSFMCEDSGAVLILVDQLGAEHLADCDHTLVPHDRISTAEQTSPPPSEVDRRNAMYVVYTSGSTGHPKGITMTAEAIENLTRWQSMLTPGPRTWTQYASLGFDVSIQEIFGTLLNGGTLVVVDEAARRDPELLLDQLRRHQVDRICLPPAMLRALAQSWAGPRTGETLSLREVFVGGEPLQLTPDVLRFLNDVGTQRLENQYGPSETHEVSSCVLVGDVDQWPLSPSVGHPIAGLDVYLLDQLLRPVPVGVTGELYVAGHGLARGYLQRPALTAERFVANPFTRNAQRMYRTGDTARWNTNGTLEFTGRADDQVKIRGFRVEPAEIATILTQHPTIRDAAILPITTTTGDTALAAYLVPTTTPPDNNHLRQYLHHHLPDHMIPTWFIPLNTLPLNQNGKIDRTAIPNPTNTQPNTPTPPKNTQEKLILNLWQELLHRTDINTTDNFFDLGGHSLIATRIVSRLRHQFNVEIPVRTLFEHPTITHLAQAVTDAITDQISQLSTDQVRDMLG